MDDYISNSNNVGPAAPFVASGPPHVGVYQLRRVGPPSTVQNSASLIRLPDDGEVTVGRGPAADYFLDSAVTLRLISRVHATIKGEKIPGGHSRFTIINSGLNGTYINDRKMGRFPDNQQVLLEGDKITFGHPGCASLQPGEYAPQLDSEFQFIFECVPASKAAQCDRYRNHSRTVPLGANLRHSCHHKQSSVFKTSNIIPRLTDSPLSNASTSEKENEVTSSVCADVRNTLPGRAYARLPSKNYHEHCQLDLKLNTVCKYGHDTGHVLSFRNKKLGCVAVSDILSNPVFPPQLETSNPKLCLYNASTDLACSNPSEFLNYSNIVTDSQFPPPPTEDAWNLEASGNADVLLAQSHSEKNSCPPNYQDIHPPVSLSESFDKLGASFMDDIEVNSTVIVLGDEVDDEEDDDNASSGDDGGEHKNSGDDCEGLSSVVCVNETAPSVTTTMTQIMTTSGADESSNGCIPNEDVGVANVEFLDGCEVPFGIEDIVEVTVTTENVIDEARSRFGSVNEDNDENKSNDADDDSDCSMPSLKSIHDSVLLDYIDMQASQEEMPPLVLMSDIVQSKRLTPDRAEPKAGLSYNGHISSPEVHSHKKHHAKATSISSCKSSTLCPDKASACERNHDSTQPICRLSCDCTSPWLQQQAKTVPAECQHSHSQYTEKSCLSASQMVDPQRDISCLVSANHPKNSQIDGEGSRSGSLNPCDRKLFSESPKGKKVLQNNGHDQCGLASHSSAGFLGAGKGNTDTEHKQTDCVRVSKPKSITVSDSVALCDLAVKLKNVCRQVVSQSPSKPSSTHLSKQKLHSSTVSVPKSLSSALPQPKSASSNLHRSKSTMHGLMLRTSDHPQSKSPSPESKLQSLRTSVSPQPTLSHQVKLRRGVSPIANTTTIILSSESDRKGKSSHRHHRSESRKHKDSLGEQSPASPSSSRASSQSSHHSSSSEASLMQSKSSPATSAATSRSSSRSSSSTSRSSSHAGSRSSSHGSHADSRSSSHESHADSRSSSQESHADSRSSSHRLHADSKSSSNTSGADSQLSARSSQSRLPLESVRDSGKSSASSPKQRPHSKSSRQSSRSTNGRLFKDTVPNMYSSSDEEDTVLETKTEIVKKIYSPKGKQEDTAGKGKLPGQNSFKGHKQSSHSSLSPTHSSVTAATVKPVSLPTGIETTLKPAHQDASPRATTSNISDIGMEKKPETEKQSKSEGRSEMQPVLQPQVPTKLKPLTFSQSMKPQNGMTPKPAVSRQTIPSSPSLSLTSLPWLTETTSSSSVNKPNKTANKSRPNDKNGPVPVPSSKNTPALYTGSKDTAKRYSSSHVLPRTSTSSSETSKGFSSSTLNVVTDKKPLSGPTSQAQPKTSSLKDKADIVTKSRTPKTNSAQSLSTCKDSASTPGKTHNSGVTSDLKRGRIKEVKPSDTRTDQVNTRGKRTRTHQSSSTVATSDQTDSESGDSDEPASKKRDLRPDSAQVPSHSRQRSLRTPRSVHNDKPLGRTNRTARRQKVPQTDFLPPKTSQTEGLARKPSTTRGHSQKASTSKKGKPSRAKRKNRKRISDSSSNNDEDESDDDMLDSDSGDSESWDLPDGVQYYDNLCSAKKCLNPEGKQVDWVMCDHCEQWYHVVCIGCPKDALKEDAQFHCGFC